MVIWIFGLAFGAVVAAVAGLLALASGWLMPRLRRVTRGLYAGYGGAVVVIVILWLIDAIDSGQPKLDAIGTIALGTAMFGTVFGFPVAYGAATLHDRWRPAVVDPGIFE